jgi:dihydrodipicolinate synthase/N-acetylneuraminate lyase
VPAPPLLIAGACGDTGQAVSEAALARDLGYDACLLSFGGLGEWSDEDLLRHSDAVSEALPLMGFYPQVAIGGRPLGYRFWRRWSEIERAVAVKIAPFDRYGTLDVIRAVCDAGRREEIALYTGNDDHILGDLLATYRFDGRVAHIVGGLLGQWAVGTATAVDLLAKVALWREQETVPSEALALAEDLTALNAALFDAANGFAGCIAGIHEVLRRQGLLAGRWCLDPNEDLSPGQAEEIDRVLAAYPHLLDLSFVQAHLDEWLS